MSLLSSIEDRLLGLLSPIIAPIKGLVSIFTAFKDNTIGIFDAGTNLITSVENEYTQIRDFKSKPQWKNRVISVPHVIENIATLAQVPSQVAGAIKDLISQLKNKLNVESLNIDELEGIEDLRGLFTKLGGKLAAGFEKIFGIVTLIVDALVTIRKTIDDLQTIVDAVKTVRQDLENLDLIFLQQKNPRRLDSLSDGSPIKLRIGNLHS